MRLTVFLEARSHNISYQVKLMAIYDIVFASVEPKSSEQSQLVRCEYEGRDRLAVTTHSILGVLINSKTLVQNLLGLDTHTNRGVAVFCRKACKKTRTRNSERHTHL